LSGIWLTLNTLESKNRKELLMEIKKVGIVGCGQMGSGIALVCAQSGLQVVIRDIEEQYIQKGIAFIKSYYARSVEKGKMSQSEVDAALSRITGTIDIHVLVECDFIIEAVLERLDLKRAVFAELDKVIPRNIVLATNTSDLSIIDIAMATKRPDKVVGTHFFNPPAIMRLVEIARTIATSDETVKVVQEFVRRIGKEPVLAKDTPGFIVNRLGTPFMLEAIRMLENGLATRDDIDNAVKLGLNHPIGPLALLDFIGLDSVYHGATSIYEETHDPQYAPPVLMRKMVTAGWLGRKTGKGFYEYK
jgi:3-hydroxybutyryl-CoA dehydrogenase